MRVEEVLGQENHNLTEALGKWGTLGALGLSAALGAYTGAEGGALAKSLLGKSVPGQEPSKSIAATPQSLPPPAGPPLSRVLPLPPVPPASGEKPVPRIKPGGEATHPNFPPQLQGQLDSQGRDRINNFVQTFLPVIQQANQEILQDRAVLKSLINRQNLSPAQENWLEAKMTLYRASTAAELLQKMDSIPPSLVLSQAGLESGWGTSDIARQFNAFFGQKTWGDKNAVIAPGGERYQTFGDPKASIKSYMQNLNSHPAYTSMRQTRAQLRKANKPLNGDVLASGLEKYSTRGKDYVRELQRMIRARKWTDLDKTP